MRGPHLIVKGDLNPHLHYQTRRIAVNHNKHNVSLNAFIMGADRFWTPHSFQELARLQGVTPLLNVDVLAGGFPEGEDIDEFLKDIYEHRETA